MAIEGKLEDVGLADILQLLAMGRKTGCLTVTDRANFGYIYLEEGRVIFATVLNRPNRMGEVLVRNGVINREELSRAMEQQAIEPGRRLGAILVDRGSITPDELRKYVSVQIEEAVFHLFAWTRGSFHFDADARPEEENLSGVSINAESLLLEGARRIDEWSMIQKKIPTMDLVFAVVARPESADDEVELTADQRTILDLIDGQRTVDDLVEESGLVEFDAARAVYGLVQAGFVERSGRRKGGEPRDGGAPAQTQRRNIGAAYYRAGMYEDAEKEFLAALAFDDADPVARARLALICLRGSRFREALAHYEAAPPRVRRTYAGLRNQALALEKLGELDEALERLDLAHEIRPDDPDLFLARGIVLLLRGDAAEAHEAFARHASQARARHEAPSPIYHAFGILAAVRSGNVDAALLIGREGIAHHPSNGAILVNLGCVLEQRGEAAAAEALYLRATSESPTPPQAHKNLGDMAYRRGDHAGARAHFEIAVRLDPALGDDVFLKLGNLDYRAGDRDAALRHWKRALELNPRNEVVRTNLELAAASSVR
jgi:tetratricopeptide (TPR) repeat protein